MSAGASAAMVIAGIFFMGAGLDLAHRLKGLAAEAASVLAPAGALLAAAGAVSLIVPGFFS